MKRNPGDLFRAHQAKVQKASGPVKMSGSFQGKSNALGHGGRAAQLKARGVPGGVIGNLARTAQAAPGQKNYHGGKKHKLAPALTSPRNPSSMPNMVKPVVDRNPNSAANYGKAMNSAVSGTQTFGMLGVKKASVKRKAASTVIAPASFGKKQQQAYANKFGLPTQTSTRTRTKRKSAMSKSQALAFKGKGKKNDHDADDKMKRKASKKKAIMGCA